MNTTIVKTSHGYAIQINGETAEDGFMSEHSAKRAARHAEQQYALTHDPDYVDYCAYRAIMSQVRHWQSLRASIGETASPEDIATTRADADQSRTTCTTEIEKLRPVAEAHYQGARRWADSCRISLEEFPTNGAETR